nr:immunoglobulin light chain junction region [Macaca mulatta]MOW62193.1 immunoglobulin light chain junction region [Macaca mulatta]MOW62343.1 immunoglobulin light chain junction region [Macaca mulatta]MOW64115.1 immunoglobulin light chain junction region [Macaca mulatta]MOW64148.1 immunoglobulin light chain junction region [Macaca mulatta]
CQHSYDIPYSF